MGHAGAFSNYGEGTAVSKKCALEAAGVQLVDHPSHFGTAFAKRLGLSRSHEPRPSGQQTRSLRTLARSRPGFELDERLYGVIAKRKLWLTRDQSLKMLRERGISVSAESASNEQRKMRVLAYAERRINLKGPVLSKSNDGEVHITLDGNRDENLGSITSLGDRNTTANADQLNSEGLLGNLRKLFYEIEAVSLEVTAVLNVNGKEWKVCDAKFRLDDAALRSAGRQKEIHAMRKTELEDPMEGEAEQHGIVYLKLEGEGRIGTLVNGAGLAMNLVDSIHARGGKCANFLDTGGKATSATVKKSFQIILEDARVKTIFVNIFGGLTLCDMIADGILLAYKDLSIGLPVVVRLRGTNEKIGQKLVSGAGSNGTTG